MAERADTPAETAVNTYQIGDLTLRHVFAASGLTDVSDMQAVFDAVERALAALPGAGKPLPYSPYAEGRFVP